MDESITIFDNYHSFAHDDSLTIKEANSLGANFVNTRSTEKAFEEFRSYYKQIIAEENACEGEALSQNMTSIREYLNKHKATMRLPRKMKIGKSLDVKGVIKPAAPRRNKSSNDVFNFKKMETTLENNVAPSAPPATLLKKLKSEELVAPIPLEIQSREACGRKHKKEILTPKDDFMSVLKASAANMTNQTKNSRNNSIVFVPQCTDVSFTEESIAKYVFPEKEKTLKQITEWKRHMQTGNLDQAKRMKIENSLGEGILVGSIGFSFKSLEAVCNDTSRTTKDAYMIKLLKSTTL